MLCHSLEDPAIAASLLELLGLHTRQLSSRDNIKLTTRWCLTTVTTCKDLDQEDICKDLSRVCQPHSDQKVAFWGQGTLHATLWLCCAQHPKGT